MKFPTEYKTLWCDACQELTSHVSRNGDDFVCLICEDKNKNPKVKAVFELEMEDEFYQHMLGKIEKDGYYLLPVHQGVWVRKPEGVSGK